MAVPGAEQEPQHFYTTSAAVTFLMPGFKGRDVISVRDFSKKDLLTVLKAADSLREDPSLLRGFTLATLFFEPSTRTRLSFEAAMKRLGGSVVGFSSPEGSSVAKGETLRDTVKVAESYCDALVIRHSWEGAARLAADACSKPVINAGDGSNQHPTQALLDLYTIQRLKGLEGVRIGVVGDLKYGRTVHSLTLALKHFNAEFTFIAPDALQIQEQYLRELERSGCSFTLTSKLRGSLKGLDVLYVTRIQKERFPDLEEYERFKGFYKVTPEILRENRSLKVMHPLPRVGEIDSSFDSTRNAAYFEQAANGLRVRQALLCLVLGGVDG